MSKIIVANNIIRKDNKKCDFCYELKECFVTETLIEKIMFMFKGYKEIVDDYKFSNNIFNRRDRIITKSHKELVFSDSIPTKEKINLCICEDCVKTLYKEIK